MTRLFNDILLSFSHSHAISSFTPLYSSLFFLYLKTKCYDDFYLSLRHPEGKRVAFRVCSCKSYAHLQLNLLYIINKIFFISCHLEFQVYCIPVLFNCNVNHFISEWKYL